MVTAWCLGREAKSTEAGMEISSQNDRTKVNCIFVGNGRHCNGCVVIDGKLTCLGARLILVITCTANTRFTWLLVRKLKLERFQNLFDMTEIGR